MLARQYFLSICVKGSHAYEQGSEPGGRAIILLCGQELIAKRNSLPYSIEGPFDCDRERPLMTMMKPALEMQSALDTYNQASDLRVISNSGGFFGQVDILQMMQK